MAYERERHLWRKGAMSEEFVALGVVSMTSLGMSTGVPLLYRLLAAGVERIRLALSSPP